MPTSFSPFLSSSFSRGKRNLPKTQKKELEVEVSTPGGVHELHSRISPPAEQTDEIKDARIKDVGLKEDSITKPKSTLNSSPLRMGFGKFNQTGSKRAKPINKYPWGEEWEQIDNQPAPYKVSEDAWKLVFPGDYDAVRREAGKLYIMGREPDESIQEAVLLLEEKNWNEGKLGVLKETLGPFFPPHHQTHGFDIPSDSLKAAILSIDSTAQRHYNEILDEKLSTNEKQATAFRMRTWHAQPGCCLVCGNQAGKKDSKYQGDAIDSTCLPRMAKIGPAYGQAVIEKAKFWQEYWLNYQLSCAEENIENDDVEPAFNPSL